MDYIGILRDERTAVADAMRKIVEGAAAETRDLSDTEKASHADMEKRLSVVDDQLRRLVGQAKASRDIADLVAAETRADEVEKETAAVPERRTVGDLWTGSAQWADYRERPRGNSGILTVPWDSLETRALITTGTYPGVLRADRIAPSEAPAAQTPLLNLVGEVQVSQNSVEWVYYPAAAPLAAVVAEGSQKPEATISLTLKSVTLETIAHWVKYSRQFAADSNLGPFIDEELRRGVRDKIEANIASVLTTSADIAASAYAGTDLMEAVRVMVGEVQTAGYQPRNVVLNPADHAALDWDVFANTLRGPSVAANFWGVVPIPVGAVPAGTIFVGDFGVGMKWLARQDATVYTTDSDITGAGATAASDFRANILTTLVEGRGKAVVHRGEAIVKKAGLTVMTARQRESAAKSKA